MTGVLRRPGARQVAMGPEQAGQEAAERPRRPQGGAEQPRNRRRQRGAAAEGGGHRKVPKP
eukprot:6703580-Pyramimonas_sp.AAC.1